MTRLHEAIPPRAASDEGAIEAVDAVRVMVCGAAGAGKSTLIACLRRESQERLRQSSRVAEPRLAPSGGVDSDHLETSTATEVWRSSRTGARRFFFFEVPDDEDHIGALARAAASAEVLVICTDARWGVSSEVRRFTRVAALLGMTHVLLVVNKMDAAEWASSTFDRIADDYFAFAREIGFSSLSCIPAAARTGANVVTPADEMPWCGVAPLLSYLQELDLSELRKPTGPFRMPVEAHDLEARCVRGRIAQGSVSVGDRVRLVPAGVETTVRSVLCGGLDVTIAGSGASVSLGFADLVEASVGDVLCAALDPTEASDQFEAKLVCVNDRPLVAGRHYSMNIHGKESGASISSIKYRIDVNTGAHLAARRLVLNEMGVVNVALDCNVAFTPCTENRRLGTFTLRDGSAGDILAVGTIDFALRRASNIHWQRLTVNQHARARLKRQRPRCVWLTGLPSSGKSTIANLLEQKLHDEGLHTFLLDGDNVRHGLSRDLGFTEADRVENLRRVAEVAKLMVQAGLVVIVAFISPFRAERAFARSLFAAGEFVEVFIDTPLEECERRDPKGLYAKARSGSLVNFTGIDSPYEQPEAPEVRLSTVGLQPAECVEKLYRSLGAVKSRA